MGMGAHGRLDEMAVDSIGPISDLANLWTCKLELNVHACLGVAAPRSRSRPALWTERTLGLASLETRARRLIDMHTARNLAVHS